MSEGHDELVRRLVGDALDLPEAERAAFIRSQAGSSEEVTPEALAEALEVVVAADGMSDSFLDGPDVDPKKFVVPVASGHRLGEFIIGRELGRGASAIVFEAHQISLDRTVALKVLSSGIATSEKQIMRFHQGARSAAKLNHPGLVQVYVDGETDGTHWFAMELVQGHDLAREIALQSAGQGPFRPGAFLPGPGDPDHVVTIAKLCAEVADALHEAHQNALVHRDVKPHNILVQPSGRVKVCDFGIVYDEEMGTLTATGEIAGTPHYMSPEQARVMKRRVDHRTDVYSLGVVLFELATLRRPFTGATAIEVLSRVKAGAPRPLRRLNKAIPRDLETICMAAMAHDVGDRYPDAAAMAADLRRFLKHEPIVARPPSVGRRLRRGVRRHAWRVAAAGLAAVGVFAGWSYAKAQAAREGMAAVTISATGDQVGLTAGYWSVDPETNAPDTWHDLGALPLEDHILPPGIVRFTVSSGAGPPQEFTRVLAAGDFLRVDVPTGEGLGQEAMVLIPSGVYAPDDGMAMAFLEGHSVSVEAFLLDRAEVSNGQYRAFLAATGHEPPEHWGSVIADQHDDLPVTNVSWRDARSYAEWAGKRLPTLAEWMWAARGAPQRTVPWVSGPAPVDRGNTQRPRTIVQNGDGFANYAASAAPVLSHEDSRTPSGLYHMLGNVREWTESPVGLWDDDGFVQSIDEYCIAGHTWDCAAYENFGSSLAGYSFLGRSRAFANFTTGFRCAQSLIPPEKRDPR